MKINGFRPTFRYKWLLLEQQVITSQGLLYFEFCIDQMNFDPRKNNFGTYEFNFNEVMKVFSCSENTARNWHKELLQKGFLLPAEKKKVCLLPNPERYMSQGLFKAGTANTTAEREKDQPVEFILQSIAPKPQHIEQKVQPVAQIKTISQISNTSKAFSSFKVESKVVGVGRDYHQIYEQGNYKGLTPDDMKFLDGNDYLGSLSWVEETNHKTVGDLPEEQIQALLGGDSAI